MRLLRRILARFFLSALCWLGFLIVSAAVCFLVCAASPSLRKNAAIRWMGNYVLLLILVGFAVGLVGIVIALWWQLISALAAVSDACAHIGMSPPFELRLPSFVQETQLTLQQADARIRANEAAARDAEQRKNDLVVYLAHDLKTPIASITGYLTLLHDEPDIPAAQVSRYLDVTLKNALRLDDLIDEFFEITRFNLSHITLNYSKINLTLLLEQLCFEFQPMLSEKGLSCQLELPPGLEAECDADKIERVFENLLRNAVSYSFPDCRISIYGKVEQVLERDFAVLRFVNHGNTIPKEKLSRIFEQFYRLDSSRSTRTGGAGLGLAIARQIIGLHGGDIRAESEDDTIVFTVRLPLYRKKIV